MDAKTIAAAAGVQVTTLNAWIFRGIIPSVGSGTRGRARDFSHDQAVQIGLMVELVRLGLGAPEASSHAEKFRQHPWKRLLLIRDPPVDPTKVFRFDANLQLQPADPASVTQVQEALRNFPIVTGFEDDSQLPDIFKKFGGPPTTYVVINIERIAETMRRAEENWQARREAAG